MKKSFFKFLLFFPVFLLIACTSDSAESVAVPIVEPVVNEPNGFTFENQFYPLNSLLIGDFNHTFNPATVSNTMRFKFSSATFDQVFGTSGYSNAKIVSIQYQDTKLNARDINNFDYLDVYLNAKCMDGHYTFDDFLFDGQFLQAQNVKLNIKYLSGTKIYATFIFTRTDGKVLTGSYFGEYNLQQYN